MGGVAAAIVFLAGLSACREQESRIAVEHRAIDRLIPLFAFYESDFPGVRVTNLAQVFHDRPYPDGLEEIFREFGHNAGFSNSFYEKYAFPVRIVTNRFVEGEILLLNAEPFSDRHREPGRMVLSKSGASNTSYRIKWISEKNIQEVFAQANVTIPKSVPMPLPPPKPQAEELQLPPFFTFTTAIDQFASIYGLNGLTLRYALLMVPVVLFLAVAFWLWRRSRR